MSLKEKIFGAVRVISCAGLMYCTGCTEAELGAFAAEGLAGKSKDPAVASAIRGYAWGDVEHERRMKEAEAGKTEVNMNVGSGDEQNNRGTVIGYYDENKTTQPPQQQTLPEVFFHEYYVDEDNNGFWSVNEFKGMKNVFKMDEPITAVSLWKVVNGDLNGKRVTLDIIGLDTNKIIYNQGKLERDPDSIIRATISPAADWTTNYRLSAKEIKEQLGGNRFRAYWNLDGKPMKYGDFMIVDVQKDVNDTRNSNDANSI